ncbi:MAG: hypothetical protein F4Y81_02100 [Rhodothermaceae bacterium]|nr:hypothetical protein [Rhodothermaceae bacterium]MYG70213.1 hypothetical protein [Rhodothermaceae bacterium]
MERVVKVIPRPKPTRAGKHLARLVENYDKPILRPFEFFALILGLYQDAPAEKLYLRKKKPDLEEYNRFKRMLNYMDVVRYDKDYGKRALRVLTNSDCPAEEIVCLVDPTCYVSHLSAMQRWGLTNRSPRFLMMTRPERETWQNMLRVYRKKILDEQNISDIHHADIYPLHVIDHPQRVRGQSIYMLTTKASGLSLVGQGTHMRISTIGQTFLDMLQKPDLCGGMSHVLDVWEENAATYLDQIIPSIDAARSGLVKSRAGYIFQEYLGLEHPTIDKWKAFSQRGGSRKLDPSKEFAPTYSETWMISINV